MEAWFFAQSTAPHVYYRKEKRSNEADWAAGVHAVGI